MVTKPTGRPRGRTPKPAAPKGPVGRPGFASDSERWGLATVECIVQNGIRGGLSEAAVLDMAATIRFGFVLPTPENAEALRHGLPLRFGLISSKLDRLPLNRRKQDPADPHEPRHKNAFTLIAHDLGRTLRKLRKRDGARLQTMVDVLNCYRGGEVAEAQRLAASIGESAYFEKVLLLRYAPGAARVSG
jgi:hypothetical protein